jgi:PadR family transcriptional regulator PadR
MVDRIDQMRKGTTTLVLLKLLADAEEPVHGYGIIQRLEARCEGFLRFREGLIYPQLSKLEKRGWIEGRWIGEPGTRRRKVYAITGAGLQQLDAELAQWKGFCCAMRLLLTADL